MITGPASCISLGGRRILAACLVTILMAWAGCQSVKKMAAIMGELRDVQSAVVKATGHDEVTVNLSNGHYLAVGLVNSPSADWPKERRQSQAREIAQLAYDKLRLRASLDTVAVTYVAHRRYLLVFNYTNGMDSFAFKASEMEHPRPDGGVKK